MGPGAKQRDISSFFSVKPKPEGGAAGAQPKDAAKEAKRAAAAPEARKDTEAGGGDGRRLKRLKRAGADAAPAPADAAGQEEGLEDAMEEEGAPRGGEQQQQQQGSEQQQSKDAQSKGEQQQQAGAEGQQQQQQQQKEGEGTAAEEAPQQPPPAPSPGKVSRSEASQAFGKLFAKAKAGAPAGGKAKAAASPAGGAKGKAGGGGKAAGAPSPKAAEQQQPSPKQQRQEGEEERKEAEGEEGEKKGAAAAAPPAAASAKAARASASAAADAVGSGSGSDDEVEEEVEEEGEESSGPGEDEEGAGGASGSASAGAGAAAKKAAAKKATKKAPKGSKVASAVDGVGSGAIEAAARYATVDVDKLVTWPAGAPVPYGHLTATFEAIAGTTKRLEIIAALTGCFRAILARSPSDLLPAVYLCSNRVGPPHEGLELGVGDAILIRALAENTGRKEAALKKEYEEAGDLGAVAAASRSAQRLLFKPKPLTLAAVFAGFREIATAAGAKSQERKRGLIGKLLVSSQGEEPGYIIRSLQGKLRIGLAEQSLLAALAHAASLHKEGAGGGTLALAERLAAAEAAVKQVYSECPSFDRLVPALVDHPLGELEGRVTFTPGVPVKPMLAKATNGVAEVLEKFSGCEFTCEYKYDGERCQIHVQQGGKVVALYSRNAEDQTPKFPDVVSRLPGWLAEGVDSVVIDGEVVAYDPATKTIKPFQILSTRARKDVELSDIKVSVAVFAFDCLYLNGRSLLHAPLSERRAALYGAVKAKEGEVGFATAKTSRDVEELAAFLNEAVAASTEGLIVKTMHDVYQPSRRSNHWLKLKKDYLDGCGDTFDVVPIGAYYGKGKRSGVYGAYLLAVYDPDSEGYQTISKLGTGFSEEQLGALAEALRPHALAGPRPYYQFGEGQAPDVWLDPVAVWEVKAADLSVSPVHQAARGLVEPGKGISIRFPRLLRVREDKSPEDATTAAQVADMYRAQAVVAAQRGPAGDGDDD